MVGRRTKSSSRFRDTSSRLNLGKSVSSRERRKLRQTDRKVRLKRGSGKTSRVAKPHVAKSSAAGQQDWSTLRLLCVGGLFALLWLTLWWRAWDVQLRKGPELAARAHRQHVATELVSGRRGEILDRNGQLLARSVESLSVFARPVEVKNVRQAAVVLAKALGRSPQSMRKLLSGKRRFVWIARRVSDKVAAKVRDAKISGLYLTKEYQRLYPNRQLAGRLLGFVGLDDKGLEGLELAYDSVLNGESSKHVVLRDAAGRKLYLNGTERDGSLKGQDVQLTLDAQIQFFAEDALADAVTKHEGKWGGAIVVEVASGDILAWAEYPSFNPNSYRSSSPSRWRNRIATDAFEPGSTAKTFLLAAALEEGKITSDSLYYCENGKWKLHGVRIKDTHKYEWLTADKILRYSSNIGVAKIGLELGAKAYSGYLEELGFGRRTGVPVRGEAKGILRPANRWQQIDLANASFGQGFAATTLQVAQAYTTLANHGVYKPLRLIKNSVREPAEEQQEKRVFSTETADAVLAMMRGVVEEDGTGRAARISGIEIGGKTGTAQKASAKGGYGKEYSSSFVGVFPALNPKYVIVTIVDEPQRSHYASAVAAPAFRSIAMKTLGYKGTLPEAALIATEQKEAQAPNKLSAGNTGPVEVRKAVAQALSVESTNVPNVVGVSLRRAVEAFARKGIIPEIRGNGLKIRKQVPVAGAPWPATGTAKYILWVTDQSS